MVDFSPTEPWLYLVILAGFLGFVIIFGLVMLLSKKKSKQKKAAAALEDNSKEPDEK